MRRVVQALLRLFPAEFRARYGAEVREMLVQRAREIRRHQGWWAVSRMLAFEGADLVRAARAERREARGREPLYGGRVEGPGGAMGSRNGNAMPPPAPGPRGPQRWRATLAADTRLAWRTLRHSPGFLLAAGITLALGIGATTAIFTVINGVLLAPLPYPDPGALAAVWLRSEQLGYDRIAHTTSTYLSFRDHQRSFAEFGTYMADAAIITGGGEPERVDSMGVTDGALRALGARAVVGRLYAPDDVQPGAEPKLILSHGFWQRRYGGDDGIVGDTIVFQGTPVEVIGVLDRDFRFLAEQPAVYWPIRLDPAEMPRVLSFDYSVVGRLAAGVSREQAAAELAALIPASVERYAWITPEQAQEWNLGVAVRPLRDAIVPDSIGSLLWVLFGAVGIVLLIACANVASLFLVRAEARRAEIAVRTALGATRGVLVRQFIVESVLLAAIGGCAGLMIAYAGVPLLLGLAPVTLPRAVDIGVDPATLAFCLLVSALAGLVFGVFPISHYGAPDLVPALKAGGRGAGAGRRGNRLRSLLVVAEVAMALVLLVGAGLMIRSFVALAAVDPGLRAPERVLTFRVALPRGEFPEEDQAITAYQQILDRIAAIPGVEAAGAASGLTMQFRSNQNSFLAEGVPPDESGGALNGAYKAVAGDYFEASGIPLLAGRTISWEDVRQRRPVGLVTERVATHFFGSPQAALGRRVRHSGNDPWREIIGVVGDIRDRGLRQEPTPVAFWPVVVQDFLGIESWLRRDMAVVVRAGARDPMALLPQVREAIWSVDPDLPLAEIDTLDGVVARYLASTSFTLVMLAIAAGVAVVLGTIGIYGVVAYAFAQRRREIGVRIALGAAQGAIRSMVLKQGLRVGVAGVVLGLAGAVALARFLAAMVYDVGTLDPFTYVAAALLTGGVALLASYLPALRATRVDPVEALRR